MSVGCGDAVETVANELPPRPTVEVGLSEIAVGATPGRSVTWVDAVAPFHVAVTVAVVVAVTLLVWRGNDTEKLPASTNTDGGGATAGESLDSATTAPPGGALPVSITIAPGCAPPVIDEGEIVSDFNAVGCTVSVADADLPFSDAVIVAARGEVVWPACIWNCVQAAFAGITMDAGTGATDALELASAMGVCVDGAEVSCTETQVVLPLVTGEVVNETDTGVGGAELMVNVRADDQAVTAAVDADASPWAERTRQNFWPGVSDSTVRVGPLSCGSSSSIFLNLLSFAICSS